jgi:hypothetical protein
MDFFLGFVTDNFYILTLQKLSLGAECPTQYMVKTWASTVSMGLEFSETEIMIGKLIRPRARDPDS